MNFTTRALLLLPLLAACARPLTSSEVEVAHALFGSSLDTSKVTVSNNLGLLPPPEPRPAREADAATPTKAPQGLCDRKRSTTRHYTSPAAFVLWDGIFVHEPYYSADAFRGFPDYAPYPSSVLMAHELVHVWQWQNRAITGYSPLVSAGESVEHIDPYWFKIDPQAEFLTFGYEQQAAMVQDFVCYALFDSTSPRLNELARVLRPVLPVDNFLTKLAR